MQNKFGCLVYEMFFTDKLRQSLNVQSHSIRGKFLIHEIFLHAFIVLNNPFLSFNAYFYLIISLHIYQYVNFYPNQFTWEWPKSGRNVVPFTHIFFLFWIDIEDEPLCRFDNCISVGPRLGE